MQFKIDQIPIGLVEDHADSIIHRSFIPSGDMSQHIAHEVHPTLLPTGSYENLAPGLLQPFMRITDDQLDCFMASFDQRTQECQPEVFIFARSQVKSQQEGVLRHRPHQWRLPVPGGHHDGYVAL
jgi:hypothetical protein